jgi:hypothetical protein
MECNIENSIFYFMKIFLPMHSSVVATILRSDLTNAAVTINGELTKQCV